MTARITEAEWEVMKVLWARAPRTAAEIAACLAGPTGWKPQTVKTLLARLVGKKAVAYDKVGREYHYRPAVTQELAARREADSLAKRIFSNATAPMLARFIEAADLDHDDIQELRRVLDRQQAGTRKS
jgi:BlaI family penicillinase repressor